MTQAEKSFGPRPARRARPGFPRRGHDHGLCVEDAISRAAELSARRGLHLTELRRRVLELVWRSHEPIGAYEILARLRRRGRPAAPPTVYRALDFLLEQGFVHRIESQSAFVGCAHPGAVHAGQFLICGSCGVAAELDDSRIRKAVEKSAKTAGFSVERQTIELRGLCPRCRPQRRR
jgi:Fur family transcriptional regulator, zinc uptake regulator